MAQPCQPCQCIPYKSIRSCGPSKGISIIQPACQTLPGGSVVNNPCFHTMSVQKSYWTYKFFTDCSTTTLAISNFCIPICESINQSHIIVSENIDGCGNYKPVNFELIKGDPKFGNAPKGFQWLKVETGKRYEKGVSVAYRLEITGDFSAEVQPIKVKAGNTMYTFDCGCFLVPACPNEDKLLVVNNCDYAVRNNKVSLDYDIEVVNVGTAPLNNVKFFDKIFYPSILTLGPLTVIPPTLRVNASVPGEVINSGNLGTINPGQVIPIKYTVPVAKIPFQGTFPFSNTAAATSSNTSAEDKGNYLLEVVKLNAATRCTIKGKQVIFTIKLANANKSPETKVSIVDQLTIPEGLTVQFNNFDGCKATFDGTGTPVPSNKNVPGKVKINIECNNITVPQNGAVQKNVVMTIISTILGSRKSVSNTLQTVSPANPGQVFFETTKEPDTAKAIITTPRAK